MSQRSTSGDESPFAGVHTVLPTPFTQDDSLDLASLGRLVAFVIERGVDGLLILGVMGEAGKLTTAEQEQVISTAVEAAGGRAQVVVGASAAGTKLSVLKASRARELGADGILIAPPLQDDATILAHFSTIGDAVDLPIIVHDYPQATGIRMTPALIAELCNRVQQIKAVKLEDPPTGPKLQALKHVCPRMTILGALGGMYFLEELGRGADGVMTGFGFPEVLVEIFRDYRAGREQEAAQRFYSACPLLRFEFQPGVGLALRKETYKRRGAIACARVRPPGVQIDDDLRRELDGILHFCGFSEGLA